MTTHNQRIQSLTQRITLLNERLNEDAALDSDRQSELINLKIEYEAEIRALHRAQWEEETQRVDLDDRY